MKYFSTRNPGIFGVTFREAVIKGLAPDGGLFLPEKIGKLSASFFDTIEKMEPRDIAFEVARTLLDDDIPEADLRKIVDETLSFPCKVVKIKDNIYSLELFHGPTLAFKDVGARFMSRVLRYLVNGQHRPVNVLVATSGDTGSAVANGFLGVDKVRVFVLYPKEKVSEAQESQFATLGSNIYPIEVDGTFDDCQRIVKEAFSDKELNGKYFLTSANSINLARLLPQTFYYFIAYASLKNEIGEEGLEICVPSGNFGNLTAGVIAMLMGLPVRRFIAANNSNDIFYKYLKTSEYIPAKSVETLANAMDVGNPSNFERLVALLGSYKGIVDKIDGLPVTDTTILATIKECYDETGYILDPHGACAYYALTKLQIPGTTGVFLETAHPSKFQPTVEKALDKNIELHPVLAEFLKREKKNYSINPHLEELVRLISEI